MDRDQLIEEKFLPMLKRSTRRDGVVSVSVADLATLIGVELADVMPADQAAAKDQEIRELRDKVTRAELERDAALRAADARPAKPVEPANQPAAPAAEAAAEEPAIEEPPAPKPEDAGEPGARGIDFD